MPHRDKHSSDSAVKDSKRDALRRAPFAKSLARMIVDRTDPSSMAISVCGVWGEGKSNVLNFIEEELARHPQKAICVRFNPWRFSDIDSLLHAFFQFLAEAIGKGATASFRERETRCLDDALR